MNTSKLCIRTAHPALRSSLVAAILVALLGAPGASRASEPLETETANTLKAGVLQLEGIVEYQTSADGTEFATPMAFEYGILNDLELLVEPVFYTAIAPASGSTARGLGDLESTATFRFLHEGGPVPLNVAVAFEVKVPTAKNKAIGTGKFDYTGYLIASKKLGPFDLHGNVGYAILGQPAGTKLRNIWNFNAAVVYHTTDHLDLLSEFLSATSPVPAGSEPPENSANPEISGGELVGMLGARYYFIPKLCWLSAAVTYDNNKAWLVRSALSWRIPTY